MNLEFVIKAFAAYAPGLQSTADWQAWAKRPGLPLGDASPELSEMPAMARRRLGPLGRTAVQVAYWCQGGDRGMPVVLASRYGDAARSLDLLGELARDHALSPTAFGLSVHNAIGAQYSIARGDTANYLSVAAGPASAAAAVVEAVALLHDGADEVMVICYDAPLPGAYAFYADEPATCYAWAWRVARPVNSTQPRIGLSVDSGANASGCDGESTLPYGLDVLRFALVEDAVLRRCVDDRLWTWRRHAG